MNVLYFNKYCIFINSAICGARRFSLYEKLCNKAADRTGKAFNKLLGNTSKKSKYYVGSFIGDSPVPAMTGMKKVSGGKENSRRIAVLNKLFMTHITELMATGSAANVLAGLNLEISRVSIASTFRQLNVYWLAQGTEKDKIIESRLLEISTSLRHELSQLRVMGEVPKIIFFKDKHLSNINKIEELLQGADFGDDYLPLSTGARFKQVASSTEEENQQDLEPEEELPLMSHNTLNLRHDVILGKIQKSIEKSKAIHRQQPNLLPETNDPSVIPVIDLMTSKERKEGLEKFLMQRKIQLQKNIKKQRRYTPEVFLNKKDDDDFPYIDEFDKYSERDFIDEEKS